MSGAAYSARRSSLGRSQHAELTQRLDRDDVARPASAIPVLDLDRHSPGAVPLAARARQQTHGLHPLGPALGDEPAGRGAHERRVQLPALAGDQLRMRHHRVPDPAERRAERRVTDPRWVGQAREGEGQRAQRQAKGDHAAAIGRRDDARNRRVGQNGHGLEGELLDRVVGLPVGLDRPAGGLGVQRHAGVLARAVVADARSAARRRAPGAGPSRCRTGRPRHRPAPRASGHRRAGRPAPCGRGGPRRHATRP